MREAAEVSGVDTVLEIGPGLGTLTTELAGHAKQVVAVEFDENLASQLKKSHGNIPNLTVVHDDILRFNLQTLPKDYKVAANVPYYITSKIVKLLLTSPNPPSVAALLVQKEVAERMSAKPGDMSVLGVSAQLYAEVSLGRIVEADLFTPPPEVDSQIVILKRRESPLFPDIEDKDFFRVVKAGFGERRKQLRSSLSGGLHMPKEQIDKLLDHAGVDQTARAQELSLEQWAKLTRAIPHFPA